MEHFSQIIYQLSAIPIDSIHYDENPFSIIIRFQNGHVVKEPFDGIFRLFLITLKSVRSKLVTNPRDIECAISAPLNYFEYLGYQKGEVWEFELDEDAKLIIQFS